ncbi:MAG: DNA mismatch repair protein MutS, partial [Firmicutes bacterium]|nr:DNA mismatch repair protein MutS [Bacillota bacterium]
YLRLTQRGEVGHLRWPRAYQLDEYMYLDANTRRNLELTRTLREGKVEGSLLWVLDPTVTGMGARTLRGWLEAPLRQRAAIEERLAAVEELTGDFGRREDLRRLLARAADLPRLVARLSCRTGNARDLLGLGNTLALLPELGEVLAVFTAGALVRLRERLAPLPGLAEKILGAIAPDAPTTLKEGGIFRPGFHPELDELREAARGGREWVAALEARERERTGIKSLKVGFNQVFGYYIEVTRANLAMVPPDYVRRQTLANAERFVTEELKEYERRILGADERARALEYELFCALRDEVVAETKRLQEIGIALGELDALLSLAEVAVKNNYVRPEIVEDGSLSLVAARHPVVEQSLPPGEFVPNDCHLDPQGVRVQIITGPNMSGKSTYLRQVALVVLLAHIGSFVPARAAKIGLVDRIFTRIGAADDLAGGRSTFLVEMSETAEILRAATAASLLILDEIGRGTGTIDGEAIARAVLEYIHDRIRAKALFATHYHELTALAEERPGMANFNVSVIREGEEIRFCHQLRPGAADRSYGIEVARLAGLPPAVLTRARELQLQLEEARGKLSTMPKPVVPAPVRQMSLFGPEKEEMEAVYRALVSLPLEEMTPLEAFTWLLDLKKRLQGRSRKRRMGR